MPTRTEQERSHRHKALYAFVGFYAVAYVGFIIAGTVQNLRYGGGWNPFEPGYAPAQISADDPVVSGVSYPLLPLDDIVRYAIVIVGDLAILWFWWFVMSRLENLTDRDGGAPAGGGQAIAAPDVRTASLTMHPDDRPLFNASIKLCWVLIVIVMVSGASLLPWTVIRFGWYNP